MKKAKAAVVLCGLAVAAVPLAGSAVAATNPTATTGGATAVTATSATLHGTVNPNHNATSYHFEYGKTTSYGARTPDGPTNPARGNQSVTANITGLTPSTTYHYRILATSVGFTAVGKDRTFTTPAAPPNSATLGANPVTPVFGHTTTIAGQVTGPQNAGITVTLQHQPFPFTAAFANFATTTTDNAGNFSFVVTPGLNTRYRAQAKTKPAITSPVTQVNVAYVISMQTKGKRVRHGKRVRFSGVVVPAHDGAVVQIEKRGKGGIFRIVGRTLLKHSLPTQSTYSKRVRIHRTGVYRVHTLAGPDHADGFSANKRIRVP